MSICQVMASNEYCYIMYCQVKSFVICSRNAIDDVLTNSFEYCTERNLCLEHKWHAFNLVILTKFMELQY